MNKEKIGEMLGLVNKIMIITLSIMIIVRVVLFIPTVVQGKSMMPTLQSKDGFLVNKISYKFHNVDRFDIIVFHENEGDDVVKRIIGLPGDTIQYKNDILYINGKAVDEPYLTDYKKQISEGNLTGDFSLQELTGEVRVPEGYVFVLGDNRKVSKDSRMFGFVSQGRIVGKGEAVIWPLKHVKVL
ncbi:signal peptidase I (plasmid) [Bacillus mycoides]|nr:signal peptidase I [Bacillus mycoides]